MRARIKKSAEGFTLIEIMLALLVVTVGIVAMTGLLSTALDTSARSHDDLHAVSFSELVFNYYHATTNWNSIPPEGPWTVPDYNGNRVDLRQGKFTCKVPGFETHEQETYTVSYLFTAHERNANIKTLTLKVWPGLSTHGPARMFYTELYNWADK